MTRSEVKLHLRENIQRQKAFFENRGPGGLLVFVSKASDGEEDKDSDDLRNKAGLAGNVYRAVITEDGSIAPERSAVEAAVEEFVRKHREDLEQRAFPPSGDAIPCVYAHWDIGWHTAAMTGLPPRFSRGAWWLEPNLDWNVIGELRYNPDNPWLLTAKHTHRAVWRYWEEDYWTMPFIHRSPLDYANGLRGTALFLEMLTAPDRVKRLLDWCVSWQVQVESFMYGDIDVSEGWGTAIMQTWLPDRAVWVNGDPVGLISREMMREFEQPYTGRLFTSVGGGFFHNHTLGLYQADQVAATPGILVQNFTKDPNRPTVEQTLLRDSSARDRILEASLQTPILITRMSPQSLLSVLSIVREGRFMLHVECEKESQLDEVVLAVRRAGRT